MDRAKQSVRHDSGGLRAAGPKCIGGGLVLIERWFIRAPKQGRGAISQPRLASHIAVGFSPTSILCPIRWSVAVGHHGAQILQPNRGRCDAVPRAEVELGQVT